MQEQGSIPARTSETLSLLILLKSFTLPGGCRNGNVSSDKKKGSVLPLSPKAFHWRPRCLSVDCCLQPGPAAAWLLGLGQLLHSRTVPLLSPQYGWHPELRVLQAQAPGLTPPFGKLLQLGLLPAERVGVSSCCHLGSGAGKSHIVSSSPEGAVPTHLFSRAEASLILSSTYSTSTSVPLPVPVFLSLFLSLCLFIHYLVLSLNSAHPSQGLLLHRDKICTIYSFLISLVTQFAQEMWSAS